MSLLLGVWLSKPQSIFKYFKSLKEPLHKLPHQKYEEIMLESVAFGRALVVDTPEAVWDTMPCRIVPKQLLFVAVGRLDNREELYTALKLSDRNLSDTSLMLEAYLAWGKNTPTKLLGDWSFAAYDETQQELFLARDQYGCHCLYYTFDETQFQFASSKKMLLNAVNFQKKINTPYFVQQFTTSEQQDLTSTPFEGLHYLPTGHTLTFKNGQAKLDCYWFPENTSLRYYKNPQQYADELRTLLTQTVEARLRSYSPVALTLSGGLDSSSVTSLVARMQTDPNQKVNTFSHVPFFVEDIKKITNKYAFLDETDHILAFAQQYPNVETNLLRTKHISLIEGMQGLLDVHDNIIPAPCNAYWLMNIYRTVQQAGYGSLLVASAGNVGMSFEGVYYLQSLRRLYEQKGFYQTVKTGVLLPIVHKYLPSYNPLRTGLINALQNQSALNKNLLEEWKVIDKIKKSSLYHYTTPVPDAKTALLLRIDPWKSFRCQFSGEVSNYFGFSKRDPTADIRVLEYCLSIPNEIFIGEDGTRRQLIRNMMKGYLPNKVLYEKKVGHQAADIYFHIMAGKTEIEAVLNEVIQEPTFKYFYNVQKLQQDWKAFKISRPETPGVLNDFLHSLMFGLFLKKYGL